MTYLVLPPELILVIALHLTQRDLIRWSLVNKFTHNALIRARYRSLLVTPKNVSSYLQGSNFDAQYLTYVKELQIDCREWKEVSDIKKCLQLAQMIPAQQLTHLQLQLGSGASTTEIQESTIFLRQNRLRSLTLYPWPDNQPYPQGLATLSKVVELKLCTSGLLGAVSANTIDTGRVLAAKSSIQSFHIGGRLNGSISPRQIEGGRLQKLFRGISQVPGLQLKLKQIRLDHCTFNNPDHLPWEFINCGKVHTLVFQNCLDISSDLRVFSSVSLLPWSLKSLEVKFWDHQMYLAPEQLQHMETFLKDDRICNLTNLYVEVPNGQRLLSSEAIACHQKLRSLTINATDGNGWLLVYTTEDIRKILSHCDLLQNLSCTIPAIQDQDFYSSVSESKSLKCLHAIGYRQCESKTPSWMWPRCHGGYGETDEMEQVAWRVLAPEHNNSSLIGRVCIREFLIHWGENYCSSWEQESSRFRFSSSSEQLLLCDRAEL